MRADGEHGYLAISDDILRNAAEQQMCQSGAAMGSHDDHLAVQFERGIDNRRARRTFANQRFGIGDQLLKLVHVPQSSLTQQRKWIKAGSDTACLCNAKDVDDMQWN